ncbi:MAG: hypothetical protein ACRDNL_07340 [Spirillospora sp.]
MRRLNRGGELSGFHLRNARLSVGRGDAHWQQDVPDQAGIARGHANWTAELTGAWTRRWARCPGALGRALDAAVAGRAAVGDVALADQ